MQKLQEKNAIITGGSRGIGLATARLFAAHGARSLLVARDEARLAQAVREIPEATGLRADVARMDDLTRLADTARERLGHVDVLFLNAGYAEATHFENVTEDHFDKVVNTNFKSVFFALQKLLPLLSRGAAVIVNTSITNRRAFPEYSAYAACKAALRSLVRSFALGLIARGIRVNAVSPGPIDTPFLNDLPLPNEVRDRWMRSLPTGRLGDPAEVARVALFLACDDSSYVIGEEIVVDGGLSARRPAQ